MASGSIVTNSSISPITGFCFYAEVLVGDDGGSGGPPEYDVGVAADNNSTGTIIWDGDLTNGFDSGWIPVQLVVAAGGGTGGLNWLVSGGSPPTITYNGVTYGAIQQVKIVAAVQAPAGFFWRGISVQFYKAGVETDSYNLRTGPQVNAAGSTPPVAEEEILTITPVAQDNDSVTITGQIRMENASTTQPPPTAMFGQIYVFCASCSVL
jgi:hypothetical protein